MGEATDCNGVRSSLVELCLASPKLFVIPAEHLTASGITSAFANLLVGRRGVSELWIGRFNTAFACYFERASELADKAPDCWRAPRAANVCIVQNQDETRPYYLPFVKTSWLLYESDFDAERSNVEFGTYQFAHVERLAATGDPGVTWLHNLGYFLERTPEERSAFAQGCSVSTRPDAEAFRALGALMPELDSFAHDQLGKTRSSNDPTARIAFAGLDVPETHQATCQTIAKSFLAEAHNATYRYFQGQQSSSGLDVDGVLAWLADHAPKLLVTDQFGGALWNSDEPGDTASLRAVLEGGAPAALASLREDWTVIDRHSKAFLSALVDPNTLVFPDDGLDQGDGIFLHAEHRKIAYSLVQPGLQTLAEEAPPYHRLLVGARTVHEWGHLAAEAGVVHVPAELEEAHAEHHRRLVDAFDDLVANAPEALRATADREVGLLMEDGCHLGDLPLQRVGDYQANLLAREFLSEAEMETYARANVRPLVDEEGVGPYLALARHAYEYQYLRLTEMANPLDYFLATTWFADTYFEAGIVTLSQTRQLFDTVSALFDCYRIDTAQIRLPRAGEHDW
ncbi:MAG: hypothetical protein AAGF92_07925 [Myxococcota bacterium]